jgi:hypothetical protein
MECKFIYLQYYVSNNALHHSSFGRIHIYEYANMLSKTVGLDLNNKSTLVLLSKSLGVQFKPSFLQYARSTRIMVQP